VDARVGASGDREPVGRREYGRERRAQLLFDRAQPELDGPAVEPGAVVLEGELELRAYGAGAAAVSAGSSSRATRTSGAGGT
jgi:hypothetical protein